MSIPINPHYNAFVHHYSFYTALKRKNINERIFDIALHIIFCLPGMVFVLMAFCTGPTIYLKKKKYDTLPTKEEKIAYVARFIIEFVGLGILLLPVDLVGTVWASFIYKKNFKLRRQSHVDLPAL